MLSEPNSVSGGGRASGVPAMGATVREQETRIAATNPAAQKLKIPRHASA